MSGERNRFLLEDERLKVEVASWEEPEGTRFDRSGVVTQVWMKDGGHTFCTSEGPEGFRNGGVGICGEFGIWEALGYEEAQVGDSFPKLGVGLLTKMSMEPYRFHETYLCRPYSCETEVGHAHLVFRILPEACQGYAAELEKRIELNGQGGFKILYTLHNRGTKPIRTQEYVHNFLRVNDYAIGPDYALRFSQEGELEEMEQHYTPKVLRIRERGRLEWDHVPDAAFYARFSHPDEEGNPDTALVDVNFWELTHIPTGISVRESCSCPVITTAIWGLKHVISPEMFVKIDVQPGCSAAWSRNYDFYIK